jgi:hypothetical protein
VQRQVAADQPTNLVAVVKALNGLVSAKYEQAAEKQEYQQEAK